MNALFNTPSLLAPGQTAPDFELKNPAGETVNLYTLLKTGWVVLFFYPKDHSPVCTTQVCTFRDSYSEFQATGTHILGISGDSAQSHEDFAQKQHLPFPLLCDNKGKVAKQYGVTKTFGLIPGRATFVIDDQGTVRMAYSDMFNGKAHVEKALSLLREQRDQQA